jgi:putative transposase
MPRKKLTHVRPAWAKESDPIFLTICCRDRKRDQLTSEKNWQALVSATEAMLSNHTWNPRLMVAMPDHVHIIVDIPKITGIAEAIRQFKAKTATAGQIDWQRDAFDHRIRNETAVRDKWHYVLMNPVRANLCAVPSEWPYTKIWPRNRPPQGGPR